MHIFRAAKHPPVISPRKRKAGIIDQIRGESQIASHLHRSFDRIVRDDSGKDESVDARASQALFQIGVDGRIIG
jgi:hypothetical protein